MTGDPTQPAEPRPTWLKPMTLGLGLLVAVAAAVFPLLDEPYRPFNFAAFGALGLFVAARVGLLPGLLLSLGAKLASDLLNYRHHGFDPAYLPSTPIYVCFACYALFGYWLLRKTESPVKIAGVAVLSGLPFFFITNGLVWWDSSLYPSGIDGLFQSYLAGIPFHRATLASDLAFGAVLFGLHAILSRAYFPAERVAPGTV